MTTRRGRLMRTPAASGTTAMMFAPRATMAAHVSIADAAKAWTGDTAVKSRRYGPASRRDLSRLLLRGQARHDGCQPGSNRGAQSGARIGARQRPEGAIVSHGNIIERQRVEPYRR
jgi:hypothetical protein